MAAALLGAGLGVILLALVVVFGPLLERFHCILCNSLSACSCSSLVCGGFAKLFYVHQGSSRFHDENKAFVSEEQALKAAGRYARLLQTR